MVEWGRRSYLGPGEIVSFSSLNIQKIIEKCKQVGVRNNFVFGLMYTTRVSLPILERANLISNYCRENYCFYIDNRNITGFCLHKDSLHLLDRRKKILANNFAVNWSNFFYRNVHAPFTNIFLNDSELKRIPSLGTDRQVLHYERLKHNKNPMVGYLNLNSLRNKLTYLRVILKYFLSLDYFLFSETKLDESFPNAQFTLDGCEIRARRNRIKFRERLIEYMRKDLICKS